MKNYFLLLGLLAFSCSDNNSNGGNDNSNFDRLLWVTLSDSEGNSLYNSSEYSTENIRYYHLINNELQIPAGNVSGPTFTVIDNFLRMKLFLNSDPNEEYPITVIEWNDTETDTIKAHFDRGEENNEDYELCDQVLVNDVLVWDNTTPSPFGRHITIIK